MHAPLPPQHKVPAHLLHFILTVGTLGAWGLVWIGVHLYCKRHNQRENDRFSRQAAQAAAINDATRHADVGWHYQQYRWLAGQIRQMVPGQAVRRPFVVDGNPVPGAQRYQTPPAQRYPVRPRPFVGPPVLRTPDAEPSGRHSPAVVQTTALPQVNLKKD